MDTTVGHITVAEYRALPDKPGVRMELHDGELFEIAYPKKRHWDIQDRIMDLLKPQLQKYGRVGMEFAFRPMPEYNLWAADVAFVRHDRIMLMDRNDNLRGAPDLVIEVESPSNTAPEFEKREKICLGKGCQEFWVVYPSLQLVRVATADGKVKRLERGDSIDLTVAPGVTVAVDDIFASDEKI
ncbi:MAG TPA: Uma2 family endonuclease [Bryobacteraceae bacterium]|nr:Uma2 family endonuclease [Bryobacteraceae bacterium]